MFLLAGPLVLLVVKHLHLVLYELGDALNLEDDIRGRGGRGHVRLAKAASNAGQRPAMGCRGRNSPAMAAARIESQVGWALAPTGSKECQEA